MENLAWRVEEYGPWEEVLRLEHCACPSPAPGEVRLRVLAAGINFADTLAIQGKYQIRAPLPFTPGIEVVAEVVEAGASVSPDWVGKRVITSLPWGGFAQQVCAPQAGCLEIPRGMAVETAASFLVTYQTAWFGLVHKGQLRPKEWLLVTNAAGGVGTAAVQLGLALGAQVIASAGSQEKLALCRSIGAQEVIDQSEGNLIERVAAITGGAGADVVYESVGGDVFEDATRCVAVDGRLIVVGFAGGTIPSIQANRIMLKNIAVAGVNWGHYRDVCSPLVQTAHEELCKLHAEGKLTPQIGKTYSFADLPTALTDLRTRKTTGKSLLLVA